MTDKEQIMINGVDVSGCEYLTYQLEEDGQYYWFCKISPTGGPDECEYNPECFYKRVLKQLARKTQEYQNLADILRDTDTYSEVCNACKDDILIYPSISDKTNYTDNEVDAITLRRIINILEGKKQECKKLKERLQANQPTGICETCMAKAILQNDRYRKNLDEIEEIAKSFNKNELCFYKEINECDCCDMGADCNYLRRAKILYIINKAKEKSDG